MLDYSHCFRKKFTDSIYQKLLKGESLNLVGDKNTGRKRLLEDLKKLSQQESELINVILIDLNGMQHSFEEFEKEVKAQLHLPISPLPQGTHLISQDSSQNNFPLKQPPMDLSILLEKYQLNKQRLFLFLHNFDVILNNPEHKFPKIFFDDLNSLKNKSNISLCCVTQKPHTQSLIKYRDLGNDQIVSRTSWLELRIIDFAKPTSSELETEINKRLENNIRWTELSEKETVIQTLTEHQYYYEFLNLIVDDFDMDLSNTSIQKRLKRCHDKYAKYYSNRPQQKSFNPIRSIKGLIDYCASTWSKIRGKNE